MKNNIHLGQNFLSKFNILQKFINMRRDNFEDKENFYIYCILYNMCNICTNKIIISYNYKLYRKFDIISYFNIA